jgi:hypothetical protein
MAWFDIVHEVRHPKHPAGDWQLVFQYGAYVHEDDRRDSGYRFIWRRPNGDLVARPARIETMADLKLLIDIATQQGWGTY